MEHAIFWFRRDLRLQDNAGLYHALRSGLKVQPVFIFDKNILQRLQNRTDARVMFLHDTLTHLQSELEAFGATLDVRYGQPDLIWPQILADYKVKTVFTNRDYEPYALQRDHTIETFLKSQNVYFQNFKDQVIFEKLEVTKDDGGPYTVFTPYSRKWRAKLDTKAALDGSGDSYFLQSYPTEKYFNAFLQQPPRQIPTLAEMNFQRSDIEIPSTQVVRSIIKNYTEQRNFPALPGTTRLGIHFRFGTISIREKARSAKSLNDTFFSELIWRDFYSQILSNFQHVAQAPFRAAYANINWRNNETEFKAWCEGRTGYPLVDAGLRELNATGFMHNRVRMLVSSFLSKHLLINWQWGEAYFAEKLLDFDLASNNGGWQWAAGCGTDAAPYFRIFSPEAQLLKFDKGLEYVKKWVPEYGSAAYPTPIVEHTFARARCLEVYKAALSQEEA